MLLNQNDLEEKIKIAKDQLEDDMRFAAIKEKYCRKERELELWYKHMRGEKIAEEEIKEYGIYTGVLKRK